MKKLSLQTMIEVSALAAMALILDLLPSLKFGPSISISFAMVPIFIAALRWGFLAGVTSGFLWGILQIAVGDAWILTPMQAFIEYFLAFASVGVAGLFSNAVKAKATNGHKLQALSIVAVSVFVGGAARYFWHFLAGAIFFKKYAIEAGKTPFVYSFIVNGTTFFFSSLACVIVLVLLLSKALVLITSARKKDGASLKKTA